MKFLENLDTSRKRFCSGSGVNTDYKTFITQPVSQQVSSKTGSHSATDCSENELDIFISAQRLLLFGSFLLISPAVSFKLSSLLSVSAVADRKIFGLFLLCTMFPKLTVHLTQGCYLPASCQLVDIDLASGTSQQYSVICEMHLQPFPHSKSTSDHILKQFLSAAGMERTASFSAVTRFSGCSLKMCVKLVFQAAHPLAR